MSNVDFFVDKIPKNTENFYKGLCVSVDLRFLCHRICGVLTGAKRDLLS